MLFNFQMSKVDTKTINEKLDELLNKIDLLFVMSKRRNVGEQYTRKL